MEGKVMSGNKYFGILWYLHISFLNDQSEYNSPTYKIQKFQDALLKTPNKIFITRENLSLDDAIIRNFGRIKLTVRIVIK